MDPEDSSEFEEEEEDYDDDDDDDDDLMLFILPALYLATTEMETPGQTSKPSDGTGMETTGQAVFGDAKWVCKVLEDDRGQGYVTAMTGKFVKPPSTQTHLKISSDPCYAPYFENCIGAIDGIHVPMTLSDSEAAPYRNRQESISQNVMLACDFDLNFVYSCGREGSASDAAVLYSAIESGFEVPIGKYYLVDGGYANTPSFLAPYLEVPYHTEEQEQINSQPQDYRELFNLRHAQLRGHIKRAIGLLKMRFPILNVPTAYRKDTQLKIPAAAVVLHNVFQGQGGDEELLNDQTIPFASRKPVTLPSGDDTYGYDVAAFNNECDMGNALRDGIAQRIWADYERSMYMPMPDFTMEEVGVKECQGE
ncbi:unnamed protein product [Urochloa humidicola]